MAFHALSFVVVAEWTDTQGTALVRILPAHHQKITYYVITNRLLWGF